MADVITRFKLETTQYDSKLRDEANRLAEFTRQCSMAGNEFGKFAQKNVEAARALGSFTPSATNAKDKVKELVGAFNDVAKAYNALTKEQQQSDFGKAMAESLGQLSQQLKEAKKELYDMGDAVKNAGGGGLFSGLGDKMSGALQVFAGNMMTKAAGAAASLGTEIVNTVQQGIELAKQGEGIRIAFERLGRGDILDGLREATHGTVTDLELMKAAVKFNDFKLPVEELGTMLAFAQQKAKDTGQSVDYMVDSIVTGLGRKSLMILDNLGLSATEVKEKMKETGDMTKAVGEIIREQMSKAGDYVETAADRAAQANVSLQNKMEELGRKFAPVEEASSQLWTSMKIGILDIIGGPLATLLNQLTEAGRLKNMLNSMNGEAGSGNTKVDNQLKKLNVIKKAGGSDYIFNSTLNGMMEDYNRQIMALDAQIKNGGKKPGAKSGESQDVRYLQQKMDALKVMRDQLAAGAKELSKPITIETNTGGGVVSGVGGGGRSGGGGSTFNLDSIAFKAMDGVKADPDKYFQSVWKMIGESGRKQIAETMDKQWDYGKDISEKPEVKEEEKLSEQLSNLSGKIGGLAGGLSSITSGFKAFGIELPKEVDSIIGVISGVSQIISGVGTIIQLFSTTSQAANTVALTANTTMMGGLIAALEVNAATNLLPFANGGIVHAANGYVPGNNYSGDQVPALLNSGELVLNKAQQNALANELQGNGMQNLHLRTEVSGRNLIVVIENDLKARGKGQLATFKG